MSRLRLSAPLPSNLTRWLNDVHPAWLQLGAGPFYDLVPFHSPRSPLHLDYHGNAADIAGSVIFRNLRLYLTLIGEGRIALLPSGAMTSESLDLLLTTMDWPDFDTEMTRHLRRPLDQETICPLDFLMALAIAARLIQIDGRRLAVTDAGRRLRENLIDASMVRAVFEAAFARVNPRTLTKLAHPWVHEQAGIVFWCLSITADLPRSVPQLTRYCFVPPEKFLDEPLNVLEVYMRAVYLTPLSWFGLLKSMPAVEATRVQEPLYQKTPLFDRFMQFDIERAQPVERPN